MKFVNNIQLRVFSNPEDDKAQIKNTLFSFTGYSQEQLDEEKIKYKETNAKGFSQKTIVIMELVLEKERHCNKFLKKLNESLDAESKKMLVEQTNRLDDNMNFFLRLDKDELMEGKCVLTDSGNCFHISMNIEAHPRRKDIAHKIVKEIFKEK